VVTVAAAAVAMAAAEGVATVAEGVAKAGVVEVVGVVEVRMATVVMAEVLPERRRRTRTAPRTGMR